MAIRYLNCSYMSSCSDVSKKITVLLGTLRQNIYSSLQQYLGANVLAIDYSRHYLGVGSRRAHSWIELVLYRGHQTRCRWLCYSTIQQTSLSDVIITELWCAKALFLEGHTYKDLVMLGKLRGGWLKQSQNHAGFIQWALTFCLIALMRNF